MSQYNTSKCIFPDGFSDGNINPPFVPCDPLAPVSACCAIGESCIGAGLCYSDTGGIYRGACTDSTWKDPACSKYCTDATGDAASSQGGFQFLLQCLIDGSTSQWSCLNTNTCGDGNVFDFYAYGIQYLNISGLAASEKKQASAIKEAWGPISTGTALSSLAPTPSPVGSSGGRGKAAVSSPACTGSSKDDSAVAIGAGVGVPLGVLFLAALAGMLFYRQKYKKELDRASRSTEMSQEPMRTPAVSPPPTYGYGYGHGQVAYKQNDPSELSDSWPAAREAPERR